MSNNDNNTNTQLIASTASTSATKITPKIEPFATSLALYLSMLLLGLLLTFSTHLSDTMLVLLGHSTEVYTLFFASEFNSSCMSSFHLLLSGRFIASLKLIGSLSASTWALAFDPRLELSCDHLASVLRCNFRAPVASVILVRCQMIAFFKSVELKISIDSCYA